MKKILLFTLFLVALSLNPIFAQRVLTLDESVQLALQNNYQLQSSRLDMRAARQTREAARTKYFPSISADGAMYSADKNLLEISTQGGNLPVYNGNPMTLLTASQFAYMPGSTMGLLKSGTFGMLNAVQPIFAGGRIRSGNKLASLGLDVSAQKNRLAQNDVLIKTEEQYWLVVSLAEKSKTISKYEDLLNSLLRQVEDAHDAGIVMKNDVLKVKLKLSQIQFNKSKLENAAKLATMAFCQHIGIAYDSTLVLADPLPINGPPPSYHIDHREALKNRPEYQLLQASVSAEKYQSKMKLGEYLPQAAIGVSELYIKTDENRKRTLGMVFGTVSIPLSGWWEASHVLQERSIREESAQINCMDHAELLLLQMEKTWQEVTNAYEQLLLSEQAGAQAEENLKVNQDSYTNGMVSVADLLEAQAIVQQVKDQNVEAKAHYRMTIASYLVQTGR